ncbi:hypothetical protein [Rubricoccus marinus]|uniref:DUF5723 domain-containing protein n=1 Tax=Rubricoccus marinus TaxID=716817 RepID=A0A259U3C8_9BACT|nr:hypothetical protein [Rubricoccus marinus]OZC04314.1 hypothetical protein BSZ36_15810 [Rubricoccus marinus]
MRALALSLLALAAATPEASAQYRFGAMSQDAAVDVPEITALAMGDAVTAVPRAETSFFSNPAHLASLDGFRLTVVGAQAGIGGDAWEAYTFYRDDFGPALEEGLDTINDTDPDRLRALYDEALEVGRNQKTLDATAEALSVQFGAGPLAIGVGAFGNVRSRAKVNRGGVGVPFLDAYSQADFVVPVVAAMDLPDFPLSIGVSAAYVQRRVSAKADFVDQLEPDDEKLYLLKGEGIALSAGVVSEDFLLPGLNLGMAVSNIGGVGDLTYSESWAISTPEDEPEPADDPAEIAGLEARFAARSATPVLRMGAAYTIGLPAASPLNDLAVSADWISGSTSEFDQGPEAGVRLGAQARLAGFMNLRAGLAQGYPTAGVGLDLKYLQIDYATYGVEDGRTLGQLGRRNHVVQLRLGIF